MYCIAIGTEVSLIDKEIDRNEEVDTAKGESYIVCVLMVLYTLIINQRKRR